MLQTARDGEPFVRMVQWPSYHQPVLNRVRLDPRFAELLEPLIGGNLKQIINQVHWKAPGSLGDFAWHQDSQSRRPASAYRNLATSYVQTGLAIDPHTPKAGGMRFIPRSHLRGDLHMDCARHSLGVGDEGHGAGSGQASPQLTRSSWCSSPATSPCGAPIWSTGRARTGPTTSAASTSTAMSGRATATAANGRSATAAPVQLGPRPALVHYEELHERPEPHYVED